MKRLLHSLLILQLIFLSIILIGNNKLFGQLSTVNPNPTPLSAVEDVLLGPGVTASNITFNGSAASANIPQNSVQQFTNSSATFPLTGGIIMHTRGAPNISDPDLSAITTNTVTNGSIIEFDFIPDGNTISFSYVFASREYSSFTCSNYNDVFGFFISGPGISGPYTNNAVNLAIIPNSNNIPVGINTVNSGYASGGSSINCSNANPNWQSDSQYFTTSYNGIFSGSGLPFSDYNGATVTLPASTTTLVCGQTYHIKLAISNVGDTGWDSGVFLQAGSFSSEGVINVAGTSTSPTALSDTLVVEGCETGQFCFERDIEAAFEDVTIRYLIGGTATNGVDYTIDGLPQDSLVMEAGETEICFELTPFEDQIIEGMESVILSSYFINACGDTTFNSATLWIADKPNPPEPNAGPNQIVCNGEVADLVASLENSANVGEWTYDGPGTVTFNPNMNDPTAQVSFDIPGAYTLYLTEYNDTCALQGVDSLIIKYGEVDILVSNDTIICQNGTVTLTAQGEGGDDLVYHWGHTSNTGGTQVVSPTEQTSYTVSVETEDGCVSQVATITVDVLPPITVESSPWQSICPSDSVLLWATATGGDGGPYDYVWTTPNGAVVGTGDTIVILPDVTAVYTVSVTDGCETSPGISTSEVVFDALPPILFSVTESPLCTPAQFELINQSDMSLIDEIYWKISDGQTFAYDDTIYVDIEEVGYYDVEMVIVTPNGCYDSTSVYSMLEVVAEPIADFAYRPQPVTVVNTDVEFQNGSVGGAFYEWTFENGSPMYSNQVHPRSTFPDWITGSYEVELIVVSEYGCSDTIRKTIEVVPEVRIFVPNTFTPDGDDYNETWRVYIQGIDVHNFSLEIYNRWGEIMWESHDISVGWDGTYGNSIRRVPAGVYVWKIKTSDPFTDEKFEWQGHVNVLY